MQEVIARGAKVLLITNKSKDEIVSENIWETLEVEVLMRIFCLSFNNPITKISLLFGFKKGFDIDKPRNLAKSVTVE